MESVIICTNDYFPHHPTTLHNLNEEFLEDQKEEKKEGKVSTCAAVNKRNERCKNKPVNGTYCTIHVNFEQGTTEVQCKKIKSDKKRCKMKTKAKSGLCYYHD